MLKISVEIDDIIRHSNFNKRYLCADKYSLISFKVVSERASGKVWRSLNHLACCSTGNLNNSRASIEHSR